MISLTDFLLVYIASLMTGRWFVAPVFWAAVEVIRDRKDKK